MKKMRIFISDDSEVLQSRLVDMLTEIDGVEIVGQERGAMKTLEAVERNKPDILILDIQILDGNGIFVLEAIKKNENSPIVIMFTNYPYLQYRKRCIDAGADFFFYKSTEFEKLLDVIRKKIKSSK